mgnify:CR=1 FL=1
MKSNRGKLVRAAIFGLLYYAACILAIFYLKEKQEILNWDVAVVFLPLIFLACSTEILSKGRGHENYKPWSYIDFAAKVLAYIAAQFIFRGMAKDIWVWICLSLFALIMCVSVVCFAIMVKNTKDR